VAPVRVCPTDRLHLIRDKILHHCHDERLEQAKECYDKMLKLKEELIYKADMSE
jgi:hypothetical protein